MLFIGYLLIAMIMCIAIIKVVVSVPIVNRAIDRWEDSPEVGSVTTILIVILSYSAVFIGAVYLKSLGG